MRTKRMIGQYEVEDTDDGLRRCSHCGEYKPLDAGYHKNGPGRYRDECKVCYNVKRKENRTKKKHSDFIGSQKRRGEEEPDLDFQAWKEILIYFGGECAYCGCTPKKGQRLTRDHLVAWSKGGTTKQGNIVPACQRCNSSKGADEWRSWFMKQDFFSQERMNRIFRWRKIMGMLGESDES